MLKTVNNLEGILQGDKKPTITINELATNSINIKTQFWVDTFKSTKRSVHDTIRSQVMNDVIIALTENGYSLPANIVELKNYDLSNKINFKMD